jgi:hypothetical protein
MKYKNDGSITSEGPNPQALHDLKVKGLLGKVNELLKPEGLVVVVTYPNEDYINNSPTSIHVERWVAE